MPTTKLGKFTVNYLNPEEYHILKNEIFNQNLYFFETTELKPVILDLGANIGLSVLYFKKFFPFAKITAVEPLKQNFEILEQNIFANQLVDVQTLAVAVAPLAGPLVLHTDLANHWHSTASIIPGNWTKTQTTTAQTVEAVTLSSLINGPIDLLKIDIEGAEQAVLTAAAPKLHLVKEILCEYHPVPEQNLKSLLIFLEKIGFCLEITKKGKVVNRDRALGLVLIHAHRPALPQPGSTR